MQPLSKGGYIVVLSGGRGGHTFDCVLRQQLCCAHKPTAHLGGLGACSPRKFWKFRLPEDVSEAF